MMERELKSSSSCSEPSAETKVTTTTTTTTNLEREKADVQLFISEDDEKGGGVHVPRQKKFHLSLDNFDSEDIPEDCPYVLTSPRSLEACKRLRVKVSPKKGIN